MSKKRWFALLGAAVLFIVSVISQLSTTAATTDWGNLLDEDRISEKVKEEGTGTQKIAVANLNGVIQDENSNPLLAAGENSYRQFLAMLDQAAEDDSIDGLII